MFGFLKTKYSNILSYPNPNPNLTLTLTLTLRKSPAYNLRGYSWSQNKYKTKDKIAKCLS